MAVYQWPTAKVWFVIADNRLEREQTLDNRFDGPVICMSEFIDSLLYAIVQGEQLAQWREQYITPAMLAFTEVQVVEGKQSTAEELSEILWERYRKNKATVLTADYLPDFLEKIFGPPDL